MHRIFYSPDAGDPLTAGARALCYSNFHGCFFAQAGDLDRAKQHLTLGSDQATIFHLTAEEGIYQGAADAKAGRERCQRFLSALETFVSAGGRFVWSVEASAPLWSFASEQTASLRSALGDLAHLVHCTSFATADAIRSALDLDWRKLVVVPPGGYQPLVDRKRPSDRPKTDATRSIRDQLELEPDHCLAAHLGDEHPARSGTERLLDHWRERQPGNGALMLLGAAADRIERDEAARLRQIGVHALAGLGTAADLTERVVDADLVVLPYQQDAGALALMLALTAGRPVMIPALPALLELATPGREALTYDPDGGDEAFSACLESALTLDRGTLQAMGVHARKRADAMSWRMLGRQLADNFLRVAAGGLPVMPALEPVATAPGSIRPRLVS
jgi:hypothetical protein